MVIIVITNTQVTILIIISIAGPNTTNLRKIESGRTWGSKGKDSKIDFNSGICPLHVPTEFSNGFFKQFDLVIRIKKEELKKQGKNSTQVNKITEGDMIQAFGVTEDQMQKAAENSK